MRSHASRGERPVHHPDGMKSPRRSCAIRGGVPCSSLTAREVVVALGATHRVVIVGSGFGGLFAAKFLGRAPVEVTLVDRTNHHLFQPLLYQVATGILSEGQVAPATRDVLHRHKNVVVEMAEVTGFDLDARQVALVRPDGRPSALPVRQPDRRGGRRPVVLRARRVRRVGAGDEDAGRRARPAGPDLRRVRDGRAGGRSGAAAGVADVRRGRRRPDRRRDRRADRRARAGGRCEGSSGDSTVPTCG